MKTVENSDIENTGLLRLWHELMGEQGESLFDDFLENDGSEVTDSNNGDELVSTSHAEGFWLLKILWVDKLWLPQFGSILSGDESWIRELFAYQEEIMWASDRAAYVLLLSKRDKEGEKLIKKSLHNEYLILGEVK